LLCNSLLSFHDCLSSHNCSLSLLSHFFFFNDTATTEIYTLSLHDALPICDPGARGIETYYLNFTTEPHALEVAARENASSAESRSEEHTSELQSRGHLVCRLLLEKKKKNRKKLR